MKTNRRRAFYKGEEFPKLEKLKKNWKIIRDEFLQLNAPLMKIDRVDKSHEDVLNEVAAYVESGKEYGWVQGWGKDGANPDWIQYGLIIHDNSIPFISGKMERTLKLLKPIKGIKICALVTMFPHTSLPCHRHDEIHDEGLLQLHLPLKTASKGNYSYLNVNGEFRQHICGEPIIFDGSLDHFALNESDQKRTILYMEFSKKELAKL